MNEPIPPNVEPLPEPKPEKEKDEPLIDISDYVGDVDFAAIAAMIPPPTPRIFKDVKGTITVNTDETSDDW